MTCLFTDVATCNGESSEHLVQECLGGTLERRDVICASCNHYFGEQIDPGLCAYFGHLIDVLRPRMPARFRSIDRHARSVEGDLPLSRRGGGVVGLRKVVKQYDANGTLKALYAPADFDRAKLEQIANVLAPGRSLKYALRPLTELMGETMSGHLITFGPTEHRAACKNILEILDWQTATLGTPGYARSEPLRETRNFVRNGVWSRFVGRRSSPMFNLEDELTELFRSTKTSFANRVVVCNDSAHNRCYGLLQVANTMPLGAYLGEAVDTRSFTLLYEAGLLAGDIDRSELVDGILLPWRTFEDARFSARTDAAIEFAFYKMRQSFDRQLGRAIVLVDMTDDEKISETLRLSSVDATVNRGVAADHLLRAICEAPLRLRYGRNGLSVSDWDDVFRLPPPPDFNPEAIAASVRDTGRMGQSSGSVLSYFRQVLQALLDQHGYPKATVILEQGLGDAPQSSA